MRNLQNLSSAGTFFHQGISKIQNQQKIFYNRILLNNQKYKIYLTIIIGNKIVIIHINMKLSKSSAPKIYKDSSLPKLQVNQFQRLSYPRRDDSSLVAGVGKRHYNKNNYSSVKKIINPEFQQYQLKNFRSIGSSPLIEKMKFKQQMINSLQRKLNMGINYNAIRTEATEAPYARDYYNPIVRNQNAQKSSKEKEPNRQYFKLKTQLDVRDIDKNKYSKKLVTISNQAQSPRKYQQPKPKISIRDYIPKRHQNLLQKMYSIPQPMESLTKIQPRMYNPTYISSEF